MSRHLLSAPFLLGLVFVGSSIACGEDNEPANAQGLKFFENKIRPVLVASCYKCHSAESKEPKGGLLVDTRAGLLSGGESGPALIAGQPAKSLLLGALRHEDFEMPPGKKLSDETIADFEKWIEMGAPDPRGGGEVVAEKWELDFDEARKYWAFQPPHKSAAPAVGDKSWPTSEVDYFVLAELEKHKLRPVADADPRTLVRRIYFDLVGLPPTPQEVETFVRDTSPKKVEELIDRLLASPHFGERWGRHWLDVARYAESNGNVDNNLFPYAWRYRDYVIDSFNTDKPYDRFITEQLAGDLLPAESDDQRNTNLIATGFLALTSKPRAQNNPDFTMDLVADQIEVTTTGLLGLTVACARCHDHKFDPIPQTDYYAMAGIFTSSEMLYGVITQNNKKVGKGSPKVHALLSSNPSTSTKTNQLREALAELERKQSDLQRQFDMAKKNRKVLTNDGAGGKKRKNRQAKEKGDNGVAPAGLKRELARVDEQIAALRGQLPSEAENYAMGVREARAADCQLCIRGESARLGPRIPRGFVTVLQFEDTPAIPADASGRLELAQWITSKNNPLTARVMANRVWKQLFGQGIVTSVDNFGKLGEVPTNAALLDHLAVSFMDNDWSVKDLIRQIMLSRTYALSGEYREHEYTVDPENRYVWRHSPHRLEAEIIRDSILVVSGQLERQPMRGTLIGRYGSAEVKQGASDQISLLESNHRSIYLPSVRQSPPASLEPFDLPDNSLVIGSRDVTTVPAQTLFFLNSPFVIEQSRHAAKRLLEETSLDDSGRIDLAYRRALSRGPTPNERKMAAQMLEKLAGEGQPNDQVRIHAWATLCQALFASAEFRYVD